MKTNSCLNSKITRFKPRSIKSRLGCRKGLRKSRGEPLRLQEVANGAKPPSFIAKLVSCCFSICADGSAWARTRAGLNGRPTCRPGVICPGLSALQGWSLAAMPPGLPGGMLRPCLPLKVHQSGAVSAALQCCTAVSHPILRPTRSGEATEGRVCFDATRQALSSLFTTATASTAKDIYKGEKTKGKNYRGHISE